MEDNAETNMQFLREFTAEKISPTSDDDVQIRCGIVGNYSLKPEEISGEVTDWVLNYLEQRKCPFYLAISLAKKVALQTSTEVCKRLMHPNGENIGESEDTLLQNATSLHTEAIGRLRELCCELRDHPDQAETNMAQPTRFMSSVFAIKNGRRKMEDRHVILHDLNIACDIKGAPTNSYYAVFDGHAGVETASFASAHLHVNLANHPSFLKDPRTAITEAFKLTDNQFTERANRENLKSGATAVCALIRESTLYIAWVGDSQALLVKQGRPQIVMNPHKPEREDERKRIEELGGYVYHHGTWRVNGTLAVSRALGDGDHKPFISNEPEINVIALDGTEDFLVIACDGLWDKMSPSDVSFSLYRHLVDSPQHADSIAAKLVHRSKVMGSNDNITTIVVFLKDLPSLMAEASKYASVFPQLEGINVSSVSQIPNGTSGKSYDEQEVSDNKYQRPTYFHKDLNLDPSDWSPDQQGTHEINYQNGKYGIAEGMPPEQTSLSELPTPPIDEVVASKQFSEYSTSEQIKIFQEHLEAQGFHDVSLGEIHTSMNENLQFLPSEMADDMGYLADDVQSEVAGAKEVPKLPFEELSDVKSDVTPTATDVPSTDLVADHVVQHATHEEVLNTASDLVLNTIETAVKHVSMGSSSTEQSSSFPESCVSGNPFEKQEVDNVESDLAVNEPNPVSPKSPHKLNPNAEPFVMRGDFSSFNPDAFHPDSSMHFTGTGDISLLDLSSTSVPLQSDTLVGNSIVPEAVQGDVPDTAPVSSELHSPLPSAPPLEEACEGQRTCVSEEYIVQTDVPSAHSNNPFFSNLENDIYSRTQSAIPEVSAAIQEGQLLFDQDVGEQSCLPSKQHEVPLSSAHVCDDPVVTEDLKPVDQLSFFQESLNQPSPGQEFDQPMPLLEPVVVDQSLPLLGQEVVDQSPPLLEPAVVDQSPNVLEPAVVDQSPSVLEPAVVDQSPSVLEPAVVDQSPSVLEPAVVDQSPSVLEPTVVDQSQSVLEPTVVDQSPSVLEPAVVDQSPSVLEPAVVDQSPSVLEPAVVDQSQSVLEPAVVDQSQSVLEPAVVDQSQSVLEPAVVDQSQPVLEPAVVDQSQPVLEPAVVDQSQPVLEPTVVDQSQPVLEPAAVDQLGQKPNVQQPVADSTPTEQLAELNLQLDSLLLSDNRMLEVSDSENVNKVRSEVGEIQDSLSQLSLTGSEDTSENKTSLFVTESVDQITTSIQSDHPSQQESFGDSSTSSCVEDVSAHVTKQVIGKDSLLPKEVQDKLLEVTSSTALPSESVAEDAPAGTVAVDLKTVPDGVPEAEGVTEDSDSEKDGGWSYVKAVSSSREQKTVKKTVETSKVTTKKPAAVSVKDRKVTGKPVAGETRSKPRGNLQSTVDAAKKVAPEKVDKKVETKEKKDRLSASAVKTASPQPVPSKTLTTDRKLMKKPTSTMPRSTTTSKPNSTSLATKPASNATTSKTAPSAPKPPTGLAEKVIGKPTHSSTPFRPNPPKPPTSGTTRPLSRPASATASHSGAASASKQSILTQKPQPRASSAPLASKTLPSTKVGVTDPKSNASTGAEVKPKSTGTAFRKPLLPSAKKQDVKETKDSTNKQIIAKKTTQLPASTTSTQVRRTGVSTSSAKVDLSLKKSSVTTTTTTDTKTLKMSAGRTDISKSSTVSKTGTARSRVPAQSRQLSKPAKPESDKKASEPKPNKNGPKKIVNDTSSSDQKCNADNRVQEVNVEKGMLEVNAQETADDKVASGDPVSASEIVSKAELKQESNVIECPVSAPAEEEKV